MQQATLNNIFFYDANRYILSAFADIFDHRDMQTFATDNIFQLLQYSQIITPDVLIFNLQNNNEPAAELIAGFERQLPANDFPIIVIKPQNEPFFTHRRIAHYLHLPLDFAKLNDIIESYIHGQKLHQILLLDTYSPHSDKLHEKLDSGGYSYFEVHNADAAVHYLRKNSPQTVFVEYTPEFITARHTLPHQRIFYVDRQQDTAEIEKFLQ